MKDMASVINNGVVAILTYKNVNFPEIILTELVNKDIKRSINAYFYHNYLQFTIITNYYIITIITIVEFRSILKITQKAVFLNLLCQYTDQLWDFNKRL